MENSLNDNITNTDAAETALDDPTETVADNLQNDSVSDSRDGENSLTETARDEVAADVAVETPLSFPLPNQPKKNKKVKPVKTYHIGKKEFTSVQAKAFSKFLITLVVIACIRSFTTYVFIIPNGFAPGGVGGVSSIIYNIVVILRPEDKLLQRILDPGITTFVMNIPFIITAFFVLNKRFAVNTLTILSIYSLLMFVLGEVGCPQYMVNGNPGLQVLAAIAGGACTGFCLGFMLRNNMSMGGTDIIGKIIHKHNQSAGAQWWILICDCVVATCSGVLGIINLDFGHITASQGVVQVLTPIFFSFLSLITCSLTADAIQAGFQSSIVFNIITDKPNEISSEICRKLGRGVTVSKTIGYFTHSEHEMLTCVVSKRQIGVVKSIIHDCDPKAFTYITKAHEVAGKGFHSAG